MEGTIHSTTDSRLILRHPDGSEQPLYEVLRQRRRDLGLTVAQLEYRSGISRNAYMFFERGATKTMRQLPDVVEVLGFELQLTERKV